MSYEVKLTLFIVCAVLIGLVFLFWFFCAPVRKIVWRKAHDKLFYHKTLKVARDGDFYLINKLPLQTGNSSFVTIDHIIGGDKFIFVITDRYYDGALNAKTNEPSWFYYRKGGKKIDIPNPLLDNRFAMDRLSIASGINTSFMVGIVLVNDDCFFNVFTSDENESLLVPVSQLEKLIFLYEKRPNVKPFVKKELWQTIQDLHELGEKNHGE
ncbi:MAG: NERD domain-containing protein [Bacilli bacterium]